MTANTTPAEDPLDIVPEITALINRIQLEDDPVIRHTKIGSGACGTILAAPGSDIAFKLAKHEQAADIGGLINDFNTHYAVENAMRSYSNGVDCPRVPHLCAWIPASGMTWWVDNLALSAAARNNKIKTPCNTICSERIAPLPYAVRSLLIRKYCPEPLQKAAHQDPFNDYCLIQVYLGAKRGIGGNDSPSELVFSLRNYKLHLDQMMDLEMDLKQLARALASALAVMHWKACIDAKGVEFILGLAPSVNVRNVKISPNNITKATEHVYVGPESTNVLTSGRKINLWLLDFDRCSKITMDSAGVEMAVKTWLASEPYYPKPVQTCPVTRGIWLEFICRYLEVSQQILRDRPALQILPQKVVEGIYRSH